MAAASDNPCVACMKANCCTELRACANEMDCSGTSGEGQLTCVQDCVLAAVADGGVANEMTIRSCAGGCGRGGIVSEATSDALGCMQFGQDLPDGGSGTDCFVECLQGD
jgi:hypothetical protein